MDRKTFIVSMEWVDNVDYFTDEQYGQLFKALINHNKGLEVDIKDNLVSAIWRFIVPNIERIDNKYKSSVENGKKGGRPKKTETQKNPTKTQKNPTKTQKNPTVTQQKPIDIDIDIDIVKGKDIDIVEGKDIKEDVIEDTGTVYTGDTITFTNTNKQKNPPPTPERMKEMLEDKESLAYLDTLIKK